MNPLSVVGGARKNPEYVLWGLPKGQTDALYQKILYTQGKTMADVERVKGMASRDGWHSFRVQTIDTSKPFDARAAFAGGVRKNGKADYYAIVVDTAGNEHMVGPMSLLAAKDRIRALESKGMPDGRGGLRPLKHGGGHVRSAQAVQSAALLKYRNPATRRNHHIRVGGTFYTPGGRKGMVLGASRKGFYPVRWSDGTLGTVQDTETAAYPTEGSRANPARRPGYNSPLNARRGPSLDSREFPMSMARQAIESAQRLAADPDASLTAVTTAKHRARMWLESARQRPPMNLPNRGAARTNGAAQLPAKVGETVSLSGPGGTVRVTKTKRNEYHAALTGTRSAAWGPSGARWGNAHEIQQAIAYWLHAGPEWAF
jgi:hypothetical protein